MEDSVDTEGRREIVAPGAALLPDWVARRRASLRAKLLAAFLVIVAALVALGGVGLGALDHANQRAAELARQQAQIDSYRRLP